MKPKFLMLALGLLGFTFAKANAEPDPYSSTCTKGGKKNDLAGVIIHGESKKPIKDVVVTAYLVSKKEKAVYTDETGNYGFEELKPGTYKFVFEKSGYKRVTKEKVVVKTDEAFQLNIEMIENKDFDLVPSPLLFADF
ncbi:carboxypeptidase-like regulatory domain-containing protein [Terrimonas pollutisoli]|uniref:carboxypeptidase-like regulatory domain-containing protein n=1 Tax=Terrimonas pollutisoli TaxID=3034147 RepID=UPI0023EDBC0A|nr:carboxypeptidase-like regulatory domain-containing protein [Terrimonas sp. H1YJ31]